MTTRDEPPRPKTAPNPTSPEAKKRLATALRENLRRRKVQERARTSADETPEPEDGSP